jgi:uracil-DNA glycosylase
MHLTAQMIGEPEWQAALADEFDRPSLKGLSSFLEQEASDGKIIFPPSADLFSALRLTPLSNVKVVILGQDPYHGPGQAHGLSFSVRPGVKLPPSLRNIYKELHSDLGFMPPDHGFLEPWARQGVLLLNAVLTVESGKANAHQKRGWEQFTDAVIQRVADQPEPCVFILWGAYAQKKAAHVDESRHLIIRSAHPSPLSAHNGFWGTKPFSKANDFLIAHERKPIDWSLPRQEQSQASLF